MHSAFCIRSELSRLAWTGTLAKVWFDTEPLPGGRTPRGRRCPSGAHPPASAAAPAVCDTYGCVRAGCARQEARAQGTKERGAASSDRSSKLKNKYQVRAHRTNGEITKRKPDSTHVEDLGVGLLHLVQQHQAGRPAAHRLREGTAIAVAGVAWKQEGGVLRANLKKPGWCRLSCHCFTFKEPSRRS